MRRCENVLTWWYLSTASLCAAPNWRSPGREDQHGQVDEDRQPGGDRLQDDGRPGLGEGDDGGLLGKIKIDLKLYISPDSRHSLMIKFPRLENFLLSMSLSQTDR